MQGEGLLETHNEAFMRTIHQSLQTEEAYFRIVQYIHDKSCLKDTDLAAP